MEVTVGTFNLNNLFSRYNFEAEIDALPAGGPDMGGTVEYKFAPGSVRLRTYLGRGLNTLNKIVPVYAPMHENPTAAYITFLVKKTGIGPDTPISDATLTKLVPGIIEFENGQALESTVVTEGIRRAYLG